MHNAHTDAPAALNRTTRRALASLHKRAYTEAEAAFYISMSRSFLRQDRMHGPREQRAVGPPWIRVGRKILYLQEDLDHWLEKHRIARRELSVEAPAMHAGAKHASFAGGNLPARRDGLRLTRPPQATGRERFTTKIEGEG